MTALLAFFIVLNSLASEQTGANLYSGTGSFVQATDSLGVPGIFPHGQSLHAIQLKNSSPLYRVKDESDGPKRGTGPDDENESLYIRDRELDNFERMLNELERLHDKGTKDEVAGEVVFDRFAKLPDTAPYLDESLRSLLRDLRPHMTRNGTEAELIVWTPTPSAGAWSRAAFAAAEARREAIQYLQLNSTQASRLLSSSRQWGSQELKRPAVSVVIRKVTK